ncbi:MAG: sortase [Ruminococcus sp.]|nr:sortase [Ruminococcus sp.]
MDKTGRNRDRISKALIAVGLLLLAAAAGLIWWNSRESRLAERSSDEELEKVETVIREHTEDNSEDSEADSQPAVPFVKKREKKMPAAEAGGNEYVGYVEIPSIELKAPVMSGYSEEKLKIAPCRFYGSLTTDDLVIAGHNYMGGFSRLTSVSDGDEVTFTNMEGEVYTYTVRETEMLGPLQVTEMVQSSWDLTLFTCNYTGWERFTVRCSLTPAEQ